MMSNELDILVVGYNDERFSVAFRRAFRHWQVYSAAMPGAIYGRAFRRAYYTDGFLAHANADRLLQLLRAKGEVRHFDTFNPEYDVQTFEDAQLLRQLRRSRHPAA